MVSLHRSRIVEGTKGECGCPGRKRPDESGRGRQECLAGVLAPRFAGDCNTRPNL